MYMLLLNSYLLSLLYLAKHEGEKCKTAYLRLKENVVTTHFSSKAVFQQLHSRKTWMTINNFIYDKLQKLQNFTKPWTEKFKLKSIPCNKYRYTRDNAKLRLVYSSINLQLKQSIVK